MGQTFMDREVGVLATWNIASRGFGSCRREYSLDEFIWYFHQRGPMDPALVEQSMTLLPRRSCRISAIDYSASHTVSSCWFRKWLGVIVQPRTLALCGMIRWFCSV